MEGPLYVYIKFKNLYLHHRNVASTINVKQLSGDNMGASDLGDTCGAKTLNDDLGKTTSWANKPLDLNAAMNPCGTYASLMPKGKSLKGVISRQFCHL